MSRIRCLILDLDGTVIDSHAYTFAAFRHACAPFRQPPADEEIYRRFGPDERVILEDLVGRAAAAQAHARLQHYYARHVRDVSVHPEVAELLHTCRRWEVARGLFTGRGRASTLLLLRELGLLDSFDAIVAGEDTAPKPAGDGITLLLEKLQRRPLDTLVVGDSPLDLQAASAAGVPARLATWYAHGARHGDREPRRLDRPSQLLPLLAPHGGV